MLKAGTTRCSRDFFASGILVDNITFINVSNDLSLSSSPVHLRAIAILSDRNDLIQ